MVGRINNRSLNTNNQEAKTNGSIIDIINNKVSSKTEGATALNLDPVVEEQSEIKENSEIQTVQQKNEENILGNISMENASYFESKEEDVEKNDTRESNDGENLPEFELDSIEQITPALFSEDETVNLVNTNKGSEFEEKQEESDPSLFDDIVPEEEDYEIPAFLRRQKN